MIYPIICKKCGTQVDKVISEPGNEVTEWCKPCISKRDGKSTYYTHAEWSLIRCALGNLEPNISGRDLVLWERIMKKL